MTSKWTMSGVLLVVMVASTAVMPDAVAKSDGKKVLVQVLDSGAGQELAKTVKAIQGAGFEVGEQKKADTWRTLSEIYFAEGFEAEAQKIAAAIGAATDAVQPLTWKSRFQVVVAVGGHNVKLPRFAEYPSTEKCDGAAGSADYRSNPDAKRFHSQIDAAMKKGPNFAGCFTVVEWGCGTSCQSLVIVDVRDGRIYSPDFATSEGSWYRRGSRLFVANPIDKGVWKDSLPPSYLETRFLEWDGNALTEITKSRAALVQAELGK